MKEPISFAELLRRVEQIDGLKRIRFMTSHPKDLSDELIQVMASSKKICTHLHLPLQSGSSRILKLMNRRYTKEQYLDLVDRLRAAVPDISLTTDIIVGFPERQKRISRKPWMLYEGSVTTAPLPLSIPNGPERRRRRWKIRFRRRS